MIMFSFLFSSVSAKSRASINRNIGKLVYQTVDLSTENLRISIYIITIILATMDTCIYIHYKKLIFLHVLLTTT